MGGAGAEDERVGGFLPPVAQPPPAAPGPAQPFVSHPGHVVTDWGSGEAARRARMAEIGIWAYVAAMLVLGAVSLGWALQLEDRAGGGDVATATLDGWETASYVAAVPVLGAMIVAATLFIRWQLAAWRAARDMGAVNLRFTEGWNIGGWFVPIGNLWLPKQLINDIWRGTDASARHPDARLGSLPGVLLAWWLTWIFLSGAGFAGPWDPQSLDEQRAVAWIAVASAVLVVVPAYLARVVLRAFTARLATRAEAVRTGGRSTVAP